MIKKLKRRVVALSMVSLLVFLVALVMGINVINYLSVVHQADETLRVLVHRDQEEVPRKPGERTPDKGTPKSDGVPEMALPPDMSPEMPYESRYFSVTLTLDGTVTYTDTGRIVTVDEEQAAAYAVKALKTGDQRGFIGAFRFVRQERNHIVELTFLDCGRKWDAFHQFLLSSVGMALMGLVIAFVVIVAVAGRIVRPIAESYEKQKRFITDAGHEMKTPLTVINANVDLLEMEWGANECLQDIQQQAQRLTALTNDLVYLARMEETERPLPMVEFPLSEAVQETVWEFKAPAQTQQKEVRYHGQPLLSMRGNDKAMRQLVSLLMDNALKYTPTGGVIEVWLERQNKTVQLTVSNPVESPLSAEDLKRVFDRFYRADRSRNSETGGYGIGLSVAQAIVTAHGGKIEAWTKDGLTFFITAGFPL